MNFFEFTVEKNIHDPVLKLKELLASCVPEIRKKLQHCLSMNPTEGYARALRVLWEDYGSPAGILQAVLSTLKPKNIIGRHDLSSLRQHFRDVEAAYSLLNSLTARSGGLYDYSTPANTQEFIAKVLARTPYWISDYASQFPGLTGLNFANIVHFLGVKTSTTKDPLAVAAVELSKSLNSNSRRSASGTSTRAAAYSTDLSSATSNEGKRDSKKYAKIYTLCSLVGNFAPLMRRPDSTLYTKRSCASTAARITCQDPATSPVPVKTATAPSTQNILLFFMRAFRKELDIKRTTPMIMSPSH